MTIVELILQRAQAYPDRLAIVAADGYKAYYRDLRGLLPNVTEYVHSTFGSTGERKEVVVTNANLQLRLARLEQIRPALIGIQKILVPFLPEFSLFVLLRSYLLLNGKTMFVRGKADAAAVARMCAAECIEASPFIPKDPFFTEFLEALGSFRFEHVFVSGGAADAALYQRIGNYFGRVLYVNYGATEIGQIAGATFSDIAHIPGCVGRVAEGVTVLVTRGVIRIKCDTMVAGYRDRPAWNAAHFDGGFFYPGDTGRFEGDFLVVTGRV